MSRSKKIWIGILTILPGVMFAAYALFIFIAVFGVMGAGLTKNSPPPEGLFLMMPMAIGILVLGLILTTIMTIYHVIHISKDEKMSSNDKLMWILIVVILNWLGDVVYWYMKIWKEDKTVTSTSTF